MARLLEYSPRKPRIRSEAVRAALFFALGTIPAALVASFIMLAPAIGDDVVGLPARRTEAGATLAGAAAFVVAAGVLCRIGIKVREDIVGKRLFARSMLTVFLAGAFTVVPDIVQFVFVRPPREYDWIGPSFLLPCAGLASLAIMRVGRWGTASRD